MTRGMDRRASATYEAPEAAGAPCTVNFTRSLEDIKQPSTRSRP